MTNSIKYWWHQYRVASLIKKINKRGGVYIGGYQDRMIKFINHDYGKMWLHEGDWEYEELRSMWLNGDLIKCGERSVTSPNTGKTYVDSIFNHKSNIN
jgi:hypothetical protein